MYIGVTGASGKIGRWIVRVLLDRGHRVRAMVRPTREGFWGNTSLAIEELRGWGAEIFPADFADDDSLKRFAGNIDVLIHNGYHHVNEDHFPVEWTNLNILATIKLYDAFWKAGGRQIVFISSGAVYGKGVEYERQRFGQNRPPLDEATMRAPQGLYATYKACIEDATVVFKTVHGLAASTTLRPIGQGIGELLGIRRYDTKGYFDSELRRLVAGEQVVVPLPPEIIAVDGRDIGIACDLLVQMGGRNPAAIADWYLCGNAPITPEDFQRIFREACGELKLKVERVPQGLTYSDALIRQLGYVPRGSEATLRDHFIELAGRLGIKPPT